MHRSADPSPVNLTEPRPSPTQAMLTAAKPKSRGQWRLGVRRSLLRPTGDKAPSPGCFDQWLAEGPVLRSQGLLYKVEAAAQDFLIHQQKRMEVSDSLVSAVHDVRPLMWLHGPLDQLSGAKPPPVCRRKAARARRPRCGPPAS